MISQFLCCAALSRVWLCDPMDCSPPGSSVHGILQARILEWAAILFSRGSSQPRDQTWVSSIAGRFFTIWATWDAGYSKPWLWWRPQGCMQLQTPQMHTPNSVSLTVCARHSEPDSKPRSWHFPLIYGQHPQNRRKEFKVTSCHTWSGVWPTGLGF